MFVHLVLFVCVFTVRSHFSISHIICLLLNINENTAVKGRPSLLCEADSLFYTGAANV